MSSETHVTLSLVSPSIHHLLKATTNYSPDASTTAAALKDALLQSISKRLLPYIKPDTIFRKACALDPRMMGRARHSLEDGTHQQRDV